MQDIVEGAAEVVDILANTSAECTKTRCRRHTDENEQFLRKTTDYTNAALTTKQHSNDDSLKNATIITAAALVAGVAGVAAFAKLTATKENEQKANELAENALYIAGATTAVASTIIKKM